MTAAVEVGSLVWLIGQVLPLIVVAVVAVQWYRIGRDRGRQERDS